MSDENLQNNGDTYTSDENLPLQNKSNYFNGNPY